MNSEESADSISPPEHRMSRLLELLSEQGLTQTQVAARAGIPAQYLSDIKRNRRPLTELVARRLGEEFDFSYQWLLGVSDSMETPSPRSSAVASGSGVWLPMFPHPIAGEPRAEPAWDGASVEVSGAAAAKLNSLKLPYVLRFGRDDPRGRLHNGDLILMSQAIHVDAEICVVRYRKKLFLARRADAENKATANNRTANNHTENNDPEKWVRVSNGTELDGACDVCGHCVGVIWSPL